MSSPVSSPFALQKLADAWRMILKDGSNSFVFSPALSSSQTFCNARQKMRAQTDTLTISSSLSSATELTGSEGARAADWRRNRRGSGEYTQTPWYGVIMISGRLSVCHRIACLFLICVDSFCRRHIDHLKVYCRLINQISAWAGADAPGDDISLALIFSRHAHRKWVESCIMLRRDQTKARRRVPAALNIRKPPCQYVPRFANKSRLESIPDWLGKCFLGGIQTNMCSRREQRVAGEGCTPRVNALRVLSPIRFGVQGIVWAPTYTWITPNIFRPVLFRWSLLASCWPALICWAFRREHGVIRREPVSWCSLTKRRSNCFVCLTNLLKLLLCKHESSGHESSRMPLI